MRAACDASTDAVAALIRRSEHEGSKRARERHTPTQMGASVNLARVLGRQIVPVSSSATTCSLLRPISASHAALYPRYHDERSWLFSDYWRLRVA